MSVAASGKFANALAAAGRTACTAPRRRDDENFRDAAFARQRHGADRPRFRAAALRIGGVLDVGSGIKSRRSACAGLRPTLKRE